jgi:hypothetical protein
VDSRKSEREARLHQKSRGRPIILVNIVYRILPRTLILELVLSNAPIIDLDFWILYSFKTENTN